MSHLLYSGLRDPGSGSWVGRMRDQKTGEYMAFSERHAWVRDPQTNLPVMVPLVGGGSNKQSWVTSRQSSQVAGTQLSNTLTATSLLPTHAVYTLEPEFFDTPGIALRITGQAAVSNVVTTPGTLTLDVRMGAVIAFNGGAMTLSTTAHTSLPLYFEILLTCRAVGSGTSANLMGQGWAMGQALSFTSNPDLSTSNSIGSTLMPTTAPAVGTGFDSTASQAVNLFGTFSVSTSPTNITLHQYVLEALN